VVDVIKDSGEKICRPGEVRKEVAIKQHSGRFGSTEASIDTGAGSGGMAGAGGAGLELKRCTMQDGGNPLKIAKTYYGKQTSTRRSSERRCRSSRNRTK
jgi:hypothetical protein